MKILVPQKNLQQNRQISFPQKIVAILAINFMIIPIAFIDVSTWLYQEIYFGIMKIPKISRGSFVKMNRHKLPQLSLIQKWSCWYCEYTNSVFAWIKAVGNQTEIYSCAIKYDHKMPGQEYQVDFYKPEELKHELRNGPYLS